MSGLAKAYDFRKVIVNVDGAILTGFWEGDDSVMVDDNEDLIKSSIGADGEALFSISQDASVMFTFKMQHTGEGNGVLSRIHRSARQGGAYFFPVVITDIGSGEGVMASDCMMITAASRGHGAAATAREWKIIGACGVPVDTAYAGI